MNRQIRNREWVHRFRERLSRLWVDRGSCGSTSWVWVVTLAAVLTPLGVSAENLQGGLVVAGRGPEHQVIEDLARAFEKANLGTAVELKWNKNFRPVDMVKEGEADLAVTGEEEQGQVSTIVAWDGLAIVVNFSNPIKAVAKRDVAALLTGSIRDWVELDEKAEGRVRLILRPDDENMNQGLESSLGIAGKLPKDAERARSDQKLLNRVTGQLDAVGYLSLAAALEAVKYGTSVRILIIDGVDPAAPTVRSGAYPLKRPIVFVTARQSSPLAQAFVQFVLSGEGRQLIERTYVPAAQ